MTQNFDFAAGTVAIATALCLAALHFLTNPAQGHWQTLPRYVRAPLFPAGGLLAWRGVELLTLGLHPEVVTVGHASMAAFLALFGNFVIFFGLLTYVLSRTYPVRLWQRLNWMQQAVAEAKEAEAEGRPVRMVPTLMPVEEVNRELMESGWIVVPAAEFAGPSGRVLDDAGQRTRH